MKKIIEFMAVIVFVLMLGFSVYGGIYALSEIPKIKDDLIILDYNYNKPKR